MRDNKIGLKTRINAVYRTHLLLNYYTNKLLKDSLPTESNLKKLEEAKKKILETSKIKIQDLSNISSQSFDVKEYIDPLKIVVDMMNSELFFDTKNVLEEILTIYESSLTHLIADFMISPLDQIKLNSISFI